MGVTVRALTGAALAAAIDDLAQLRIKVFRDWPYLYDGDVAYEAGYLREFAAASDAVLVAAIDGGRIVGAATASPMAAQKPEFQAPIAARGMDVARLFYFGESVLLPGWRGRGIGHAFFDAREAAARAAGAGEACFCAVVRPADHPAHPVHYRPLDSFWHSRGYHPVEGLVTQFAWRDVGDAADSDHDMQFWLGRL